jgi:hypothetical protein
MDILILNLNASRKAFGRGVLFSSLPSRLVIGNAYGGAAAGHAGRLRAREAYTPPREEAGARTRAFLAAYPKAAYMSEVESRRELPGGGIELTMRRLRIAD